MVPQCKEKSVHLIHWEKEPFPLSEQDKGEILWWTERFCKRKDVKTSRFSYCVMKCFNVLLGRLRILCLKVKHTHKCDAIMEWHIISLHLMG